MDLGKLAEKLLRAMPFNGSKTAVGVITMLIGLAQELGVSWSEIIGIFRDNPTKTGMVIALLGLVHKLLKVKYAAKL